MEEKEKGIHVMAKMKYFPFTRIKRKGELVLVKKVVL
jgi:hypothetical protein